MSKFAHITVSHSQHAVLYRRYDLLSRGKVKVGTGSDDFGPFDPESGARYKALVGLFVEHPTFDDVTLVPR
mgnify:CR=1 FL=1